MKPHERLAEATAPDGTKLQLMRHDGDYYLRAGGVELMSTRRSHSEIELAELACAPLAERAGVQILIGGLGFGFTLRSALRLLAPDARVVVAELIQEVIDWNLNPDWELGGDSLRDTRVALLHADVRDVLRQNPESFDAILLDVDNGAVAFTTSRNTGLYSDAGVRVTAAALRDGGTLAYWSATEDKRFVKTLRRAGMTVETLTSRVYAQSRATHVILLAR